MACVTLKRSYDHGVLPSSPYDPPHFGPRPSKRRRANHGHGNNHRWNERSREREFLQQQQQPGGLGGASTSASGSSSSGGAALLPHGCGSPLSKPTRSPAPTSSVFRETPLSHSEMASNLRDELKRLRKRKQIPKRCSPPSSPEPMMDDAAAMRAAASALLTNHAQAPSTSSPAKAVAAKDKPIFTLKQMTLICEKMCQERTDNVRAEYDRILQQKLGEQYDAFVKFIDHQIEQRFSQASIPSYLS